MVTGRKARIGVVGTGWWATYTHIAALMEHPEAEVVALANRGPEKLRLAAEAFHVQKAYPGYREMLERETSDGVVISTSHEVHCEIAKAALEHGCHVTHGA